MNFELVGQQNFDDLPIETQMKVYKWEKWMAANPNYHDPGWTLGSLFVAILIISFVLGGIISNAINHK